MYGILKLDTRKMFPPQHLIKITFSTSVLGVIVQRIAYWLNWFGLSYPFLRFIKHRWIIPYSRWLNWESSFRLIDFVNSSFSSIDWSCPSHRLIDWLIDHPSYRCWGLIWIGFSFAGPTRPRPRLPVAAGLPVATGLPVSWPGLFGSRSGPGPGSAVRSGTGSPAATFAPFLDAPAVINNLDNSAV